MIRIMSFAKSDVGAIIELEKMCSDLPYVKWGGHFVIVKTEEKNVHGVEVFKVIHVSDALSYARLNSKDVVTSFKCGYPQVLLPEKENRFSIE